MPHHILGAMTLPFNNRQTAGKVGIGDDRAATENAPSGRAFNGVPTGVQVVGHPYDDVMAFRVAAAVEATGVGFPHEQWRPAL